MRNVWKETQHLKISMEWTWPRPIVMPQTWTKYLISFRIVLYYPSIGGKMVWWYLIWFHLHIHMFAHFVLRIWLETMFPIRPHPGGDSRIQWSTSAQYWWGLVEGIHYTNLWDWEWTQLSRTQLTFVTETVEKKWYGTRLPPQILFVEHWMTWWMIHRDHFLSRGYNNL